MSMKSHHYSAPPKGGKKQHHEGHEHGHPTAVGHGGDSGDMSEWGLSQGNAGHVKSNKALEVTQQPESHKLAHVDYSELTGM